MLGTVHRYGLPAANSWLLCKSVDRGSWRSFDDHSFRRQPAEPSSDLQLQRIGWFPSAANTSTATLSTAGVAPGTVTVTCNAVDDKGQTASQQTTVTVNSPPVAAAPTTKSLCTISFDRDERRPTRVDNEAKACLDDIALNAQRDPQAKLAIIGSSTVGKGKHASAESTKRAAERAVNTKEYLVD